MFRRSTRQRRYAAFVCYRSQDDALAAATISNRLARYFGRRKVFRDVESLRATTDYPSAIRAALHNTKVVVAVIGPAWLDLRDDNGVRLLDRERDWVRDELAEAFHQKIKVLPVLLKDLPANATMPEVSDLPASIRQLATTQATELSQRRLEQDLTRIVRLVREVGVPPQPWHRTELRIAALALALIVVTVLAIVLPRSGSASLDHLHPAAAPPQVATIDPCSFAMPAIVPLKHFGQVRKVAHGGNFNRCDLIVDSPNQGHALDVQFLLQQHAQSNDPGATRYRAGTVTVDAEAPSGNECDRILANSNAYALVISADLSPSGACALADAATQADIGYLNSGQRLPQRVNVPKWSLIHVDACGLLDANVLSGVGATPIGAPEFGSWTCRWDSPDLGVKLEFDQGTPDSGQLVQLGSHTGVVEPGGDGGDNNCRVEIEYHSFTGDDGDQEFEMVHVVVYGPASNTALCVPATKLAAVASTHLPN